MSSQRYERVAAAAADDDDAYAYAASHPPIALPDSPPPSFRSRNSSRRPSRDNHYFADERELDDAFGAPSDDDDDDDDDDTRDRRRLIIGQEAPSGPAPPTRRPEAPQRVVTEIPSFAPTPAPQPAAAPGSSNGRVVGGGQNDGVWANLNAKPRAGDDVDEKPPTYEQAAADATPPYWETTVLSPYNMTGNPDDVFINGLLVGSLFSFIWNALISMSFQLIGFLLTYLLHTTQAAKHGSRAGLGITLVQYGFQMRYSSTTGSGNSGATPGTPADGVPDEPNSHDFDPGQVMGGDSTPGSGVLSTTDWLAYALMIVGWFILIRAISDFLKARRQEALVRSSPDRGLGVAVVAENETPAQAV